MCGVFPETYFEGRATKFTRSTYWLVGWWRAFVPVQGFPTWFTELHSSGKHCLGDVVTRSTPLAPMIGPGAVAAGGTAVRSPKTAELVAGTLRRMVVDGQLNDGDFLPNEA